MKNKKIIIWDWNGTMLNDAELCVACMNTVLRKYQIEEIDVVKYRSTFTFPVKDYYEAIGFDFEKIDFEIPAMEFIVQYYTKIGEADLHKDTVDVLKLFKEKGLKQFALSAMEHNNLVSSLTDKGIIKFFENVSGINNHYAHSKLEMGQEMMKSLSVESKDILMIGDTIHDFEVAQRLDIDCVLVSNGHQSKERLLEATPFVVSSLLEIAEYFR
ncbi:MAG: HAD family hydrolase [Bacteroidetes bacterium]|nr:HAD family hydrolase [Bacteroidota bacterium]